MGYCPYVQRGGQLLYLPVPLDKRDVKSGMRVGTVDTPLLDGNIIANSVPDSDAFDLTGQIITGNPQNVTEIETIDDIWVTVTQLCNFFLGYANIPFVLVIAETDKRMGLNCTGYEYPPYNSDIIHTGCVASSFSVNVSSDVPFVVSYSISIVSPNR